MQSHPRTSLALSPFLLLHASVQITPTHLRFVFTTPLYSAKQDSSVVLLVSNHHLVTEKLYPTLLNLFWGPRFTHQDNKTSVSLQAATGTSAWAGQPSISTWWRQSLSRCSQLEICFNWLRVTLNPGSSYLCSSPQARWMTETSTYQSLRDTSSYNKWLLNKSPCLRHKTTASKSGQSTLLFSHLLKSSVNLSLSKPWHYNGCANDSAMKFGNLPAPHSALYSGWIGCCLYLCLLKFLYQLTAMLSSMASPCAKAEPTTSWPSNSHYLALKRHSCVPKSQVVAFAALQNSLSKSTGTADMERIPSCAFLSKDQILQLPLHTLAVEAISMSHSQIICLYYIGMGQYSSSSFKSGKSFYLFNNDN